MTIKNLKVSALVSLAILLLVVAMSFDAAAYKTKSNKQNRVRIDVRPVQLSPGKPAQFEIRMNTHSVPLDQDMLAVCVLKDDRGREYPPAGWDGSPPGGHHRSGILAFPELLDGTKSIKLVIREVADVPERVFNWSVEH